MDRVALDLGPIQIYWYSIFIFLGGLVACLIIYKEARKREIEEEFLLNLTFNSLILGIIGARLYYVIFNLNYYIANPIEILQIWNGGLAIHGGILAALIFIIWYCKKNEVNTLKMLDIIVVGLIIGQAIGRWGNFFNSEAYGSITTANQLQKAGIPEFIIRGMYILGEYRQPTFFYESVWCLFGFFSLLIIRKYRDLKVGQLSGFYLIWYGTVRFFIEGLRTDSLMLGPLKMAQIISIIFAISGLILFFYHIKKDQSKEDNLYRNSNKPKPNEMIIYYKDKR